MNERQVFRAGWAGALRGMMTGRARRAALPVGWLLVTVLAGCGRFGGPAAAPEPTDILQVAAIALPTETATPLPTPTLPSPTPDVIGTLVAEATARAIPPSAATLGPVLAAGAAERPSAGCEIPRQPETWRLAPAPEAPAEAQGSWLTQANSSLVAEVLDHDAEGRRYGLRPIEPDAPYSYSLTYSGEPLPLETGRRYRLTYWRDVPGQPPAGVGLRVEDDDGLVFLGVSLRETEGADARVLDGDRAGFAIIQLPTQCLYTEVTNCGVELRGVPVEVSREGEKVTLGPNSTSKLGGDPPLWVAVATSHFRRAVADVPCPDRTDWVLSYHIRRPAKEPATAAP